MRLLQLLTTKVAKAALAAVVPLSAVIMIRAADPPAIAQLRERTFDIYQVLRPRPYTEQPVRIVDIDEASLAAFGQWPWSRDKMAELVKRLQEYGAAVIAFDITFPEADRSSPQRVVESMPAANEVEARAIAEMAAKLPDHDGMFEFAVQQAPVVLGFSAVRGANDRRPAVKSGFAFAGVRPQDVLSRFDGTAANLEWLEQSAKGVGGLNLSARDKSGTIRRVPALFTDGDKLYPSLAIEALRVAQQQRGIVVRGTGASGELDTGAKAVLDIRVGEFTAPLTAEGEIWVYFTGDRPERYIPVKDVLDPAKSGEVRPRLDGHIVLIGTSAAGLHDAWPTPLGEFVPGVSVHANVAEQIVSQTFLHRPDWTTGAEILSIVLACALLTGLLLMVGAQYVAIAGIAAAALGIGGSWLAFTQWGLLLDPIYPVLATFAAYFSVVGVLFVVTDKEKRFVRRAFGQYVAPELLAKLEDAPGLMRLGGENREITLMFMDVRGFTAISEGMTATELVEFVNRLLSPMSDIIQSQSGTIDKYIGDGIMAFWNAPLDIADHAALACRAALNMRAALAELNARDAFHFRERGMSVPDVRVGIGINTGMACVGNMGSERRFNYSAMGDAVNVTARIESNSKLLGFDIVVSQATAQAAPGFAFLEAGDYALKGKSEVLKLFALLGDRQAAASDAFQILERQHGLLMQALSAGRTAEIASGLEQCRALGGPQLARFYDRLEEIGRKSSGRHRVFELEEL